MPLFDRTCAVEVGEVGDPDGVRLVHTREAGLRISFDVFKTRSRTADSAVVEVYNLAPETLGKLRERDLVLRLLAGYREHTNLSVLFRGDVQRMMHTRDLPDQVTRWECGDGLVDLRERKITVSFGEGTRADRVLAGIVEQMRIAVEIVDEPVGTYLKGYSYVGPADGALDEVTKRFGLEWAFRASPTGARVVIVRRFGFTSFKAVKLTPATGLIGGPAPIFETTEETETIGDPVDPDAEDVFPAEERVGYRVTSLLNPKIEPTRLIRLESADIPGRVFVVDTVRHRGDTYGQEWYSIAEVRDVTDPNAGLE